MKEKIDVLIVDDSALVRTTLEQLLSTDPDIGMITKASDPFVAAQRLREAVPDVITLDIEMPKMDGLTFLKKIMTQHPIPVVVISTLTAKGAETAIKALEYGAVEVLEKPKINTRDLLRESTEMYCRVVKAAAQAKLTRKKRGDIDPVKATPKLSADAVLGRNRSMAMMETTEKVIALGASTGGTEAIREFLQGLPDDTPGIVVVQHMPEMFTKQFAQRLDQICGVTVKEAENGDTVLRGHVYIAPGNKHMIVKRSGARYYIEIKDGPLVNRHRPSVDVLFRSVSRYAGKNAVGIILTGMGDDGARGMLEMKEAGAENIAQNEQTCVVFGMPKEAIAHGGVDYILPLGEIADKMISLSKQ